MIKKSKKRKRNKVVKKVVSFSIGAGVIVIVLVSAISQTVAFFSDTYPFDLKVGDDCSYNGHTIQDCTWEETDLKDKLFFNYNDVKPGDFGENTLSLKVKDYDSWMCAGVINVENYENGCNGPEENNDSTCNNPGKGKGELPNNLYFSIWRDYDCENDFDGNDYYIVKDTNIPSNGREWPIADATTQDGPLPADVKLCLGVAWSVSKEVGNIIQGDSLKGDVVFRAVQALNNDNFRCGYEQSTSTDGTPVVKAIFEINVEALEEILSN